MVKKGCPKGAQLRIHKRGVQLKISRKYLRDVQLEITKGYSRGIQLTIPRAVQFSPRGIQPSNLTSFFKKHK